MFRMMLRIRQVVVYQTDNRTHLWCSLMNQFDVFFLILVADNLFFGAIHYQKCMKDVVFSRISG